jgi:hypothetical protein
VHTLHSAVRHRKLDAIGVFVIALLIGGTAASLITASPRIVLARSGLVTACAGIWLLVTLATAQLWETDRGFRSVWHGLTVLWRLGLMVDALVRIFIAFALPVDAVPALDGVLYAATRLVLQVITQIALFRTGTLAKVFPRGGTAARAGACGNSQVRKPLAIPLGRPGNTRNSAAPPRILLGIGFGIQAADTSRVPELCAASRGELWISPVPPTATHLLCRALR